MAYHGSPNHRFVRKQDQARFTSACSCGWTGLTFQGTGGLRTAGLDWSCHARRAIKAEKVGAR